jgi:Na+-driven multidrug efflux pump
MVIFIGFPKLVSITSVWMFMVAVSSGNNPNIFLAIVTRVFQFAILVMIGFGQGFQPVCGFNYGAKRYDRVLRAFWFCVKVSAIFLTAMAAIGFVFSAKIVSAFRKEDLQVIAIGTRAFKFYCMAFPLSAWVVMSNMLLQTMGKAVGASIIAVSRQGLFFLPAILILPRTLGLLGVQISQPISDICSFLIALPIGLHVIKELKLQQDQAQILKGNKSGEVYISHFKEGRAHQN